MDLLGLGRPPDTGPVAGADYLRKLHKYLTVNIGRLAPQRPTPPSFAQQGYTLLTLGLDPTSQPLSRSLKVPLTLGFGAPAEQARPTAPKPVLLRLPPDRLLYLLLRWQSLPQSLPHVGRTDVAISSGVPVAARGARVDERDRKGDGDVDSVKSWVGSMRSVSLGSMGSQATTMPGMGWLGKKEEVDEDQLLLALYTAFTVLPALLIHPPFLSDKPIAELVDAGGYTQLGGIDVRIPLDVLRNLQILELEGYDPRGLLLPINPGLRSLTVRDVQDADDWLEELLVVDEGEAGEGSATARQQARFPNLRHLSLFSTTMLSFPTLPLSRLTHLDLSHNLLNSIPSSLSSMHALQYLNLSNNLITSVRNAPSVLGNITTLNLSKNRIDCLVGLERVLGLERVDVRSNELLEVGEVGRLAVLPHVKGIWCANNLFDHDGQDWRSELGAAFAFEGKQVTLDDRPWTWQEKRKIDTALTARGRSQPHSRQASSNASTSSPHPPHTPSSRQTAPTSASVAASRPQAAQPSRPADPTTAPPAAAVQKKRRPRRVITLDEDTAAASTPEERIGGSLRLPPKNGATQESIHPGNGTEVISSRRGPKRSALTTDTFSPPTGQ